MIPGLALPDAPGLEAAWQAFHFLRPTWLVLLAPIVLLWVLARRRDRRPLSSSAAIAPHLRAAMALDGGGRRRLRPVDGVALALALSTLGIAGPTWSRELDPFAAQAAPVVVVLKVARSMEAGDVAPSRLARARQKVRDLLDLRAGARTGLVAYAGAAHAVAPLTSDPGLIEPYLAALRPEVMPLAGDRAAEGVALARELLAREGGGAGGVLLIADAVDPADVAALNARPEGLAVLALLPEGTRDRGLDALAAPVARVAADASDMRRLDGLLNAAWRRAQDADASRPWKDRGPWLAWPAAALTLVWFRRGWTMRWAAIALALALAPGGLRAQDGARNLRAAAPVERPGLLDLGGPLAGWFLTPDQQGRVAAGRGEWDRAADLYADPLNRGYAQYRDGRYAEAVRTLARLDSARASFIQGLAAIRSQSYRDGVRAFETTLQRDPAYPGAAANLALARRIVDYVERTAEQSDPGDQPDLGADAVKFDNEANRGQEGRVPREDAGAGIQTAEQWMNLVDTDPGDFLRQRFALEAARAAEAPSGSPDARPASPPTAPDPASPPASPGTRP